jgi:hypothetical protein
LHALTFPHSLAPIFQRPSLRRAEYRLFSIGCDAIVICVNTNFVAGPALAHVSHATEHAGWKEALVMMRLHDNAMENLATEVLVSMISARTCEADMAA